MSLSANLHEHLQPKPTTVFGYLFLDKSFVYKVLLFSWIPWLTTSWLSPSYWLARWSWWIGHICNDGLSEEKTTEALILALNTHDKLFCVARRCQYVQGGAASLEVFGSPVDLYGNRVETATRMNYTGYKFITVLLYQFTSHNLQLKRP